MSKKNNNFIAKAHNTHVNSVVGIAIILFIAVMVGVTVWYAQKQQTVQQRANCGKGCQPPPPLIPAKDMISDIFFAFHDVWNSLYINGQYWYYVRACNGTVCYSYVCSGGSGGMCFICGQGGVTCNSAGSNVPYIPNSNPDNPQQPVNHNNANGYDPSHMRPGSYNFHGNVYGAPIINKH